MPHFLIKNNISCEFLGVFEGASEGEAVDAMARMAGYRDNVHRCEALDTEDSALEVRLVVLPSQEAFVAAGGDACPVCGGTALDLEEVHCEEGAADQDVICLTCRSGWTRLFRLGGYGSLSVGSPSTIGGPGSEVPAPIEVVSVPAALWRDVVWLLGQAQADLDDASTIVDAGEDEDFAYQQTIESLKSTQRDLEAFKRGTYPAPAEDTNSG